MRNDKNIFVKQKKPIKTLSKDVCENIQTNWDTVNEIISYV